MIEILHNSHVRSRPSIYQHPPTRPVAQHFTEESITVLDVKDELQKRETHVHEGGYVPVKIDVQGKKVDVVHRLLRTYL